MLPRNILIGLSLRHRGDWDKIYQSITFFKDYDEEEFLEKEIAKIECGILTILDEEYPQYLKEIFHPPFVLYYYGDISLIYDNKNNLSVIGTREPSVDGVNNTHKIIRSLKKEVVVVSGLAAGIDGEAHLAALYSKHPTIAVLGSGVNCPFPPQNKDLYYRIKRNPRNLIISEYPPGIFPAAEQFPLRNRLISAFGKALLVTEAKRRSGTSITIAFALEQGRDILCIPSSNLNDSVCNACIKDGAFLVENDEDVNVFF